MFWKKFTAIIASAFLIFVSACNLPGGPAVVSGTNQDPTSAMQTQVAELVKATAEVQTQVAGMVASTGAAETALANAVASTLAAMPTNTPEFTFTPSITPTPSFTPTMTFTLTPQIPMVSVSVQTNCRTGPGTAYDVLGYFNVGQTAEVVARGVYNDYWIIKLPSNPAITCWLWGQYAVVVGNTAGLPALDPPPTPTPAASFTVSFVDTTACAPQYAFQFQVDNTGSITWESINIIVTNNTASTTTIHTLDSFRSYEGCVIESNQQNLEPGEGGHVANVNPGQLNYNPAGAQFTAVVKVCSENGLAGICLEKTITFTP